MTFPYYYRRTRNTGPINGFELPSYSLPDTDDLVAWFNTSSYVGNNNDPVGTWADRSGNGHDATQSTSDYKPLFKTNTLNGYPTIQFDGIDDSLGLGDLSNHFSTTASLFVVVYLDGSPGYNVYTHQAGADSWWKYEGGTDGYLGTFRTSRFSNWPTGMPTTGWHVMTIISGTSNYIFYLDTISKGTQASSFQAGNNHNIGWNEGNYNRWLGGNIAELILYSADKTSQRSAIETYLTNKYSL